MRLSDGARKVPLSPSNRQKKKRLERSAWLYGLRPTSDDILLCRAVLQQFTG